MMKISVVIPAYNAEKFIGLCLESISKVDYPSFEVIVIDDCSRDKTAEIVKNFPVKLIKLEKNVGAATARNIGVKYATGEIIFFIDADCVVDKDWIKTLLKNFKDKQIVGAQGIYKTYNKRSSLARFVGYDANFRFMGMPLYISALGTYNCALYKSILEKEKFDEKQKGIFFEDNELGYRISRNNKIKLDLNSYVYHHHPSTFRDYFKKQKIRAAGQIILNRQGKKNDNYVGVSSMLQIPLMFFLPFSVILGFFINMLFITSLLILGTIIILNLPLLNFISKTEKFPFLIKSIYFILFRNVAWITGLFKGLFYFQ